MSRRDTSNYSQFILQIVLILAIVAKVVRLVQRSCVKDSAIATSNELSGKVSVVVEDQLTPSIGVFYCGTRVVSKWSGKCIETIVMSSRTVDDVPSCAGVVELVGVSDVLVDWCVTVVDVGVTAEVKVNLILVARKVMSGSRSVKWMWLCAYKSCSKAVMQFVQMPPALL